MANLFIGGPIDGQVLEVERTRPVGAYPTEFRVPVAPEIRLEQPPPVRAPTISSFTYTRRYLEFPDEAPAIVYYAPEGVSDYEAIKMLFRHYKDGASAF